MDILVGSGAESRTGPNARAAPDHRNGRIIRAAPGRGQGLWPPKSAPDRGLPMTDEKWEAMVSQIRRKFKVSEHTTSEPDPWDRAVRETIVFEGPTGPMKLERATRPLVLEKKPIYS